MIQAWIYREADRISGFKLTGHADAGEYGKVTLVHMGRILFVPQFLF